jgi:hypothetical protein
MSDRCEPPEHMRGRDGEHHLYYHPAGTDVRGNPITVRWGARAQGWWADHLELRGHDATQAASMGWRYLAPVAAPDLVRELVEALEGLFGEFGGTVAAARNDPRVTAARAALRRAKEAGV